MRVKGGIDLRWEGKPAETIDEEVAVRSAALLGDDYPDLRPIFDVAEGQCVLAGQRLFTDRRRPDLSYTAPLSGTVRAISHGRRRSLDSIVIDIDGDDGIRFDRPAQPDREAMQSLLMTSGCWQSFRTRPFGRIADPAKIPDAIFLTAMDTAPLAGDPAPVIKRFETWFRLGAAALCHLTDGPVYICHGNDASLPVVDGTKSVAFSGRHPAGLAGTHIHHIHPVDATRMVWHIGY